MEPLFDTHVHFSGTDASGFSVAEQLMRAAQAGVQQLVAVGGACDLNTAACKAGELAPAQIQAAIGFDRDQHAEMASDAAIRDATERLARVVHSSAELGISICAIGEIGLDYHYSPQTRDGQMALFEAQCSLAVDLDLPVIVHSRDADQDTLDILRRHAGTKAKSLKGVLHCFTGELAFAQELVQMGFCISFSGIVTFRNADALRAVAHALPESHVVVETDAPYLAPVPHRGKRNEPAFVAEVVKTLAAVRAVSFEQIAQATTRNAQALFRFPATG
ncbi:MAG: TatD family hydrolase [Kiritimatiellia bacterium]